MLRKESKIIAGQGAHLDPFSTINDFSAEVGLRVSIKASNPPKLNKSEQDDLMSFSLDDGLSIAGVAVADDSGPSPSADSVLAEDSTQLNTKPGTISSSSSLFANRANRANEDHEKVQSDSASLT